MPSQKKLTQVESLLKQLREKPNFAVIKFDRTSHTSLESLRKELKKANSKLKVVKNSLFEKALHKLSTENKDLKTFNKKSGDIKESSGLVSFDTDWSAGIKAFYDYAQKDTTLSFKVGILEGEAYLTEDLAKIAKLPSKPELMAKVIGGMKSPMFSLVYGMKFNMQKLVYVLSEKSKQTS
jgi:large subunit ribosomal protein L10